MSLISVPNVRTLIALDAGKIKISGRNNPISMNCASISGGSIEEYVVKLYGELDLERRGLIRELYTTLLAHVLGLSVPECAIIVITQQLVNSTPPAKKKGMLSKSLGMNFGSKAVESNNRYPIILTAKLRNDEIRQAVEIFTFDLLVQNSDRDHDKPNMFNTPDGFMIYDHELALPFADSSMLLGDETPWSREVLKKVSSTHCFYPKLRKQPNLNLDPFIEKLKLIEEDLLEQIKNEIPSDWLDNKSESDLVNTKKWLLETVNHIEEFKLGVLEVLA